MRGPLCLELGFKEGLSGASEKSGRTSGLVVRRVWVLPPLAIGENDFKNNNNNKAPHD